ncbi:MAG: LysR family transcriptional regulator [Comamonas sp.]
MNVTIKQLRVFCAVYELKNFTLAADAMYMTQSAVSKVCAELEDELDIPLFERTTRRVEPCDGAADFYVHAQEILANLRAAERCVASIRGLEHGSVSFSASPMMVFSLLKPVIAQFHRSYPGVSIALHELSTEESIEFVRTAKCDFALVSYSGNDPQLSARMVFRKPMQLAVPFSHALAQVDDVDWTELVRHQHITLRSAYSVRQTIDRMLSSRGLQLPSVIQAGTLASALSLVREGLGVTLVPSYAASAAREMGLKVLNIGGPTPEMHELSLLTRKDAKLSLTANTFVQALDKYLAAQNIA